jgi:hypothetical protein
MEDVENLDHMEDVENPVNLRRLVEKRDDAIPVASPNLGNGG